MPSVRAYMVLAAAGDFGTVASSSPAEDALDGFAGTVIEAWLSSDHEAADVRAAIAGVPEVASVTVAEHAAPAAAPEPRRPARTTGATVRVDAERLDQLMHLMGELVVGRTAVEGLAAQAQVPGLAEAVQDLTRSSQALQALIMQVRMIPVDAVFMRLPRLVRDLAAKLDKQVDLVLTGRETELDRTVVDMLGDPLVHLVRNALDHALETPDVRRAAGKPAAGRLEIAARHAGGNVVITVSDDGRGIDPARVARRAAERGLIERSHIPAVDVAEAVELLFATRLLDRRSDERHLRTRRRHGRRAQRDPRARRRGHPDVGAGPGHGRPGAAPADAGDPSLAARPFGQRTVRDPARPGRADAEPGGAGRPLGHRQPDAGARRRRAAAAPAVGDARLPGRRRRGLRRRRPRQRASASRSRSTSWSASGSW